MSHVGGHGHGRALCLRVHRRGGKGRGFGEQRAATPPKPSPGALMEADKRWKLDAYDRAEWEAWLQDQKQSAGVKGNNLYLQVCPPSGAYTSVNGLPPTLLLWCMSTASVLS